MSPPEEGRQFAHGSLRCLAAVAAHHGLTVSVERLVHDHAMPDAEPTTDLLLTMARSVGLKARLLRTDWQGLLSLTQVFPLIARLNNGESVLVVGVRRDEGEERVAVTDPLEQPAGLILELRREQFEGAWNRELILLKPRFSWKEAGKRFGWGWFVVQLAPHAATLRDVALAAIVLHFLGLLLPIYFQIVVDKVLVHQGESTLVVLTVGILAALLFEGALLALRQYLLLLAVTRLDLRLAGKTFRHLLALPASFFEQTAAGVTVRHLEQGERIREFLTGQLFFTLLDATALLVYLPVMYGYSPVLSGYVLLFSLGMALVAALFASPFRRRLLALYQARANQQAFLVESIQAMPAIKAMAMEPRRAQVWEGQAASVADMHFRVGKMAIVASTITQILEKILPVTVIAWGVGLVFSQELTVGALIACQMLSGRVTSPLSRMVSLFPDFQEVALSVRMLGQVMNHPTEHRATEGLRPVIRGEIVLSGVTFRYHPLSAPALDRIDLSIPAGSLVGIVGRSGSGKSTLAKLLHGIFPPQEGNLLLDGVEIREIALDHLRRHVGMVLQETRLFKGSIRENVAVARPGASPEEVWEAVRLAGAHEFIANLPQGLDTFLEEGGVNLSGGQRQRLAVARAVITRPPVLVLDEAASALDPESEAILMENLTLLAKGRTVLLISHRLTTLSECDFIVVMERGRILDVGRHGELLARCPLYLRLWQRQQRTGKP